MNLEYFFQIIETAISYFLFSNEFFKFSAEIKGKTVSFTSRFFSFIIIYVWFAIASFLELPLVMNWLVFLIILGMEVHIIFTLDYLVSYALSMFCVIMGLAVNVFFRNTVSILLNVPLHYFDKDISALKSYPIFLGFLFMALLFYILRRLHFSSHLEKMLHYRESLLFYSRTEIFIYLFLIIQLLSYSQSGDTIVIKIWGIKSALFSIFVLAIAIVYSYRVASLHYYMAKQHDISEHLIREKEDINKLWILAYTDILTGCNNRLLLDKRLKEYSGFGSSITLAFIDVNGLKNVNDQYGHIEGDNYLISIARILTAITKGSNIDLFRYGGDEFVMMTNAPDEKRFKYLLDQANEFLKNEPARYPRSISYGIVHGNCSDYPNLIATADTIMYKHKLEYYENMVRS